jgi:hypothetical protein
VFCFFLASWHLPFSFRYVTAAQADYVIYDNALRNNWQDQSWSDRQLNSTEFVHSGTYSVKITYTAVIKASTCITSGVNTSPYSTLIFWIHGGSANGAKNRYSSFTQRYLATVHSRLINSSRAAWS